MEYIINTANPNYCKYGLKAILIATAIVQLIIANKHIIPKIGISFGKVIAVQKATTHGITIINTIISNILLKLSASRSYKE